MNFTVPNKLKTLSYALIAVGVLALVYGFFIADYGHGAESHDAHANHSEMGVHDSHEGEHAAHVEEHGEAHGHHDHRAANRPWAALLVNNIFFLGISLGALFFLAVQYAAQAGWSVGVKRVMEAIALFLPIPGVIMLVIVAIGVFFHGNHIWHWTADGISDPNSPNYDSIIAGKVAYLNPLFFFIRSVIYIVGWTLAARYMRKISIEGNAAGNFDWWKKNWRLSATFIVFFAVTSSTAAWDWIMSIDTHWFSTLFGWYSFASYFVSALTVITLVTIYLKSQGYMEWVNENHLQDLGKFMFAFSIFWTYLWFSQYMLIWYSNIPEEVTYYMPRYTIYKAPFITMLVLNFLFPVLVLMGRGSKRNNGFVITAGIAILFGHWLDFFNMIMPGTVGALWGIGIMEIGLLLGYSGLFILVVANQLTKAPLLMEYHPMRVESEHHHI